MFTLHLPRKAGTLALVFAVLASIALIVLILGPLSSSAHQTAPSATAQATATSAPSYLQQAARFVHVKGNQLVTALGQTVVLRGVNRDGTDYLCTQGQSIFDGPTGPSSIAALLSWHINAVRIPLNEGCWLGLSTTDSAVPGLAYQQQITSYVHALSAAGIYVIVDLHKATPDATPNAHAFLPMPDAAHSGDFWQSVASAFADDGMVLFDLYNEPHGVSWACWLSGGAACGKSVWYPAVGMQTLVQDVRSTGASNVLLLPGVWWANDVSGVLSSLPDDPLHNLAASWHVYPHDSLCGSVACYDRMIAPLASHMPVLATEFGIGLYGTSCDTSGVSALLAWMDSHGQGYLAFSWNVGSQSCSSLSLISDWNGTPQSPSGVFYREHLQTLAAAGL